MYRLKVGNMYLSDIYVDSSIADNEFIRSVEFNTQSLYVLSDIKEANALRNKIYIVLGVNLEVEEINEANDEKELRF